MSYHDHAFCRQLLKQVMVEVRKRFTPEEIKAAWVYDTAGGRKSYEFHGPNGRYDYGLKMADCSWSAQAEGWQRLLDHLDVLPEPFPEPVAVPQLEPLTPEDAYTIASQWGSYITAGDPGAVFYTFPAGRALVEDEDHRAALLTYTDSVLADPRITAEDAADLARLRAYFATTPAQDAPVWWSGNYGVEFQLTRAQAAGASHSGRCDDDVDALRKDAALAAQLAKIDPAKLRSELKEYGSWDAAELANHEANLDRIVWLAAGDITEGRCD